MTAITSLYISKIEKCFNSEFISSIFIKNGIAIVSKILLEPHKKNEKYNRAFIEIKEWCDTESAFNFIIRLRDPIRETRIVYCEDNWWTIEINKFPNVFNKKTNILTVFYDINENNVDIDIDNLSMATVFVTEDQSIDFDNIDYEKTRQLKAIIYGFKNVDEMDDAEYFDGYLNEAHQSINDWKYEKELVSVSF